MKKKYEVSYYEYGLTRVKRRRFHLLIPALFFKFYLDKAFDKSSCARIGVRI